MKLNLAHVCIKTKDLAKTEHFYTQVLGLEKMFEFIRQGKCIGFYIRVSGNQFLEFFEDGKSENVPSAIAHLCLETEDIDAARATLEKHGVPTSEKMLGGDNSYQSWFKDPNGIDIEFHQYTDESTQLTGKNVEINW